MNNDNNLAQRAVALVNAAIDVLRWADYAPSSPVNEFLRAERRRQFRRTAMRLRRGGAEPRYANLYTADQLADVLERAVQRDEMLEEAYHEFKRITFDLGRVLEKKDPEVRKTLDALMDEMQRSAEENGPHSEAAYRYWHLQMLRAWGRQVHTNRRRQKASVPRPAPMAPDPSVEARQEMCAAELLGGAPPGETAIAIPPEGEDSGRGRMFMRIGLDKWSWLGSFECGHQRVCTSGVMPDGKHLFVSVAGAGYIIDAKTRTLVEKVGTDVVGVMHNEPPTVYVVNHNHRSLEGFGKSGRLWKTGSISAGGFHSMAMTDHEIIGHTRHPSRRGWVAFSVSIATGEVRYAEGA